MTASVSPSAPLGVSVAICTYNGAERLPATLGHLQAQIVPPEIPWEVIVIDNASTDDSAEVARAQWSPDASVPLRVAREERLGLSYARERAFAEASYPIVSFVDDDNWPCANWVGTVSDVMAKHPEVGACGGFVNPVFETLPPSWARGLIGYKKWPEGSESRDVTDTLGWLPGAGLSIRVPAYRELCDAGFRQFAVDRKGNALTVGGDVELCFALRLAGWRIWFEPALTMEHFMPARRLTWNYVCASMRGYGFSDVALDAYTALPEGARNGHSDLFQRWLWQMMRVVRCIGQNLILRPQKVIGRSLPRYEGDPDVLRIYGYLGRLHGLLNCRRSYSINHRLINRLSERLRTRAEY